MFLHRMRIQNLREKSRNEWIQVWMGTQNLGVKFRNKMDISKVKMN